MITQLQETWKIQYKVTVTFALLSKTFSLYLCDSISEISIQSTSLFIFFFFFSKSKSHCLNYCGFKVNIVANWIVSPVFFSFNIVLLSESFAFTCKLQNQFFNVFTITVGILIGISFNLQTRLVRAFTLTIFNLLIN